MAHVSSAILPSIVLCALGLLAPQLYAESLLRHGVMARTLPGNTSQLVVQALPAPSAQDALLRGNYCSYSGSSGVYTGSYSHAKWARFDGQGTFTYGSSTYSSGSSGSYYDGTTNPHNKGMYRVQDQTIYLLFSDGSVEMASVYNRRADGTIGEVMYENTLYAPALCE